MAKKSQIVRQKRLLVNPKYKSRVYNRCLRCGRQGGFLRDFGMCRICFRDLAHKGEIPGVIKASW